MTTTYSIGYSWARQLRGMAASDEEAACIERLADERGTELDVRVAASLLLRRGQRYAAGELLRMVPPDRREG